MKSVKRGPKGDWDRNFTFRPFLEVRESVQSGQLLDCRLLFLNGRPFSSMYDTSKLRGPLELFFLPKDHPSLCLLPSPSIFLCRLSLRYPDRRSPDGVGGRTRSPSTVE